jgi:hypothetical protein
MDERSIAPRGEQSLARRHGNTHLPAPVVQPPIQPPPLIYPSVSVPTQTGIPQWVWGVGIVLLQSLVGILLFISSDTWRVVGFSLAFQALPALYPLLKRSNQSLFVLPLIIIFYPAYYLTFWLTYWLIQQIF